MNFFNNLKFNNFKHLYLPFFKIRPVFLSLNFKIYGFVSFHSINSNSVFHFTVLGFSIYYIFSRSCFRMELMLSGKWAEKAYLSSFSHSPTKQSNFKIRIYEFPDGKSWANKFHASNSPFTEYSRHGTQIKLVRI